MTTSPSPNRFPVPRHTSAEISARKAEEFQSLAQLVEDLIPNFEKVEEKLFYRECMRTVGRRSDTDSELKTPLRVQVVSAPSTKG